MSRLRGSRGPQQVGSLFAVKGSGAKCGFHDRLSRRNIMDDNKDKVHPVGSGTGAAAGAATGAAVGTAVGGPAGTLVGAAVGAVAGGLVGHAVSEAADPTVEDAYWRENYRTRPYAESNRTYEHYQPAYRYGWESRERYDDKTWDQAQNDLERGWDKAKGASTQTWHEAKDATRDAW